MSKLTDKAALRTLRKETKGKVKKERRFRLPPKGFSIENALKIFETTGGIGAC